MDVFVACDCIHFSPGQEQVYNRLVVRSHIQNEYEYEFIVELYHCDDTELCMQSSYLVCKM